jgi:CubicO group peptidase (beta-lactamase class C family)
MPPARRRTSPRAVRHHWIVGALGAALLAVAVAASPPSPAAAAPLPAAPPAPVPDAAELASFFDAEVPPRLASDRVPGAVVSVVHGGRTVFARGYGLADVEGRKPFDPETSLVRIASISKLFTATAVLQLVDQGKVSLDADVNSYLTRFRVPATYERPVTLRHLLTHTAGFEDRGVGIGARTAADVPALGDELADHLPARVRPPGETSAYSNYGAALAGYVVSVVSGQPYDAYVAEHVLRPLGMRNSTAAEPVPAGLSAGQARSYEDVGGGYERIPFIFDRLAPDGAVSATAADMARFMSAHLSGGRLGDARVLEPATAGLMQRRAFAADPRIDGWALGFKERTLGGRRVVMHDGSWEGFQSAMILVPELDLGLFVSANSEGGIETVTHLMDTFFEKVVPPATTPPAPAVTGALDGVESPDGFYALTRRSRTTVEKLLTLTGEVRLRVRDDGRLSFRGRTWEPVGERLFREVGGTERLAFVTGEDGRVRYVATDRTTFEPLSRAESVTTNLVVLLGFAVPALLALLGAPVVLGIRRLRRRPWAASPRWRIARRLTLGAAATGLLFVVLLVLLLVGGIVDFLYGVPAGVYAVFLLPLVVVVLTLSGAAVTVVAWREASVGVPARTGHVVLLAGMACLVWFLVQWNLLGWRFG